MADIEYVGAAWDPKSHRIIADDNEVVAEWRVIMQRPWCMNVDSLSDSFEIFVGDNKCRIFTKDNLPDSIKFQLAVIHTIDWSEYDTYQEEIKHLNLFILPPRYPDVCKDFGWMRHGHIYVLVLPDKVLQELRGGVPRG